MTITLTADDGETLTGKLPDSWATTPLAAYAAIATAELLPARVRAVAALVGLPAEPLLANIRHYAAIRAAAPWLLSGELPEATGAVPQFKHAGTTYVHVGHLDRISAEQMEALVGFLRASDGQPLTAGPGLLAVLYCPKGKTQTGEVVSAAQAAFATLPMSIAWPALADFLRSSASVALNIRTVSALSAQVETMLAALETALQTGGDSRTSYLNLRRRLGRTWIQRVRKML
jgi:hypothetical protein